MKLFEQDELEDLEEVEDLDELDNMERRSVHGGKKPPLTAILLGIIIVLLICIGALLLILTNRKKEPVKDSTETLQQDIADYADEQKQNDKIISPSAQDAIIVEPSDTSAIPEETQKPEEETEEDVALESATVDKTAIVVDVEDENDVSYTKEYILNEMLPYFADNNLDAVWDLAHLKRYVKLSAGLKGTDSYYYIGDTDGNGAPNGRGLAIYEENTYYYGSWEHGVRSGDGRWYRFYIDEIGKPVTKKVYLAHSYAGAWSNDLPNGSGAEHYDVDVSQIEYEGRVIQNVIGNFSDGLYDGDMYANTTDYIGSTDEWYATAQKGVFVLWREMSAIGECAVWQNRDDTDLYMEINKSENKNQGMRELLRITQK